MNKSIKQKGFTLLEVMIAISIISIVLMAVFRMQSQSISMYSDVKFNTNAPFLAQYKLAEIEKSDLKDIAEENQGNFGSNFPEYSWKYKIIDVDSELIGEFFKILKQINVFVYNDNEDKVYELRTYKAYEY